MKQIFIFIIFSLILISSYCQSYLGRIVKQVNFRESPDKEATILNFLKTGTQVFIISLETENDFYNVIDIKTNTEGYIHKKFIKVEKPVQEDSQGIFTSSGETDSYSPEIEIFNNTSLTLTLKLNSEIYSFIPKEKKNLTIDPGTITYRASAPGIIPKIGSESLKNNQAYTWEFYIITRRE